jgi:superoxide dismutase, Fe-Mn family
VNTIGPSIAARSAYPERTFTLRGLDGISNGQIEEHLALYAGYVKAVNELNKDLGTMVDHGQASGKNPEFAELTRRLGFEYNGMILHEHYFSSLSPAAEPAPASGSALAAALTRSFGSVDGHSALSINGRRPSTPSAECAASGG